MTSSSKTSTAHGIASREREDSTGLTLLWEANGRAMSDWIKMNATVASGLLALSQEMAEFAQTRVRDDVEARLELGRCRNPSDALDCQRRFAQRATAHYVDGTARLTTLMANMASESFAYLRHGFDEAARSMYRESSHLSPTAD